MTSAQVIFVVFLVLAGIGAFTYGFLSVRKGKQR